MILMVFRAWLACSAMTCNGPEGSRGWSPSSESDERVRQRARYFSVPEPCCRPSRRAIDACAPLGLRRNEPGDEIEPPGDAWLDHAATEVTIKGLKRLWRMDLE